MKFKEELWQRGRLLLATDLPFSMEWENINLTREQLLFIQANAVNAAASLIETCWEGKDDTHLKIAHALKTVAREQLK